jgi:hypothetical protein
MFEIISLVAVAFAVWGVLLAVYRIGFKRKPPKSVAPLVIGLSLVSFVIYNDYSWQSRTVDALPEQAVVVERFTKTVAWQPWTLLVPRVEALVVVDTSRIRRNDKLPDFPMAELALIRRWDDTLRANHLVDCKAGRHTTVGADSELDGRGLPKDAVWETLAADSGILKTVCD